MKINRHKKYLNENDKNDEAKCEHAKRKIWLLLNSVTTKHHRSRSTFVRRDMFIHVDLKKMKKTRGPSAVV